MADNEDYEKLLGEALEERAIVAQDLAGIDSMIAFLKKKLGRTDGPVTAYPDPENLPLRHAPVVAPQPMRFPRVVSSDAFFKMNVPDAIKAFLNIVKRPQTTRSITDALQTGGLTHRAKDLYQTVFPTLMRMKDRGDIEKLANGEWGLAEWYRRSTQPQAEEEQ